MLNGVGVDYPATTRAIRMRDGSPVTADGPLAEAEGHLYDVRGAGHPRALDV